MSIIHWAEIRFFYLAHVERMSSKAYELIRNFSLERVGHTNRQAASNDVYIHVALPDESEEK